MQARSWARRAAATRPASRPRSSTSAVLAPAGRRGSLRYRARVTSTEAGRGASGPPRVLWSPPQDVLSSSRIGRYLAWLASSGGPRLRTYDEAWRWSVEEPGAFWTSLWHHFEVISHTPPIGALVDARMPGARWFPGATLNYAEHVLRLPG